MCNPFMDGSFDDFAKELGKGIKDFVREIKAQAEDFEREHGPGTFRHEFRWQDRAERPEQDGARKHREEQGPRMHAGGGANPRYATRKDEDGTLWFFFQLPGFEESGIKLSFRGDSMILKASLPEDWKERFDPDDRFRFFMRDIDEREYHVPAARYRQAEAKAVFRNGVLSVSIPPTIEEDQDTIKVEIIKEGN